MHLKYKLKIISEDVMKNIIKVFSLFFVLFILLSCAQPSEPASVEGSLSIEHHFEVSGYAVDISVSDSHLYVAEDQAGYSIFDITTNDLVSHHISFIPDTDPVMFENVRAISVVEDENLLFVYDRYGEGKGISIFDITDKVDPTFLFRHTGRTDNVIQLKSDVSTSGGADIYWTNVGESGPLYFFARWFNNFLQDQNHFLLQYSVNGFDTKTDNIYISVEQMGFYVIDRSSGDIISTTDTDGEALDVKIVDNYAIVALRQAGFAVYDVSDESNPTLVCQQETSEYIYTIDIEGDNLVLGSHSGGVYLYDISDIANPVLVGNLDSDKIGYTYKAVIKNNKIYASTRQGVFKIAID